MAVWGCNLDEVRNFIEQTSKIKNRLLEDENYLEDVVNQGANYFNIKRFFEKFVKFIKCYSEVEVPSVYRVRKCDDNGNKPYIDRGQLIYPPASPKHEDRMNNMSSRVLYTAFHEFTAMSETRLDASYIGNNFQLTRFEISKSFKVFRLGVFSDAHLNLPRDSAQSKDAMINFFGEVRHNRTMQGFSALECAMADILYDKGVNYHVLSSILADAIFTQLPQIDAILYPTMQNRYGINLAFKQSFADSMEIVFSSLNRLEEVYQNGFFKYSTLSFCEQFSEDEPFEFITADEGFFTPVYR